MSYLPGTTNFKNPLLIKDETGLTKKTCYDLPPEEHTYGKKVEDDPVTIKQVTHSWAANTASVDPALAHHNKKDFKTLNKLTVSSGIHTAKGQNAFRSTHDIKIEQKYGSKYIPVMLPEEDFTYGQANRPSTPVKLVMGNCYALMAEDQKKQFYETKASKSVNKGCNFKNTRNMELLKERNQKFMNFQNKPNKQQKFKLTRFENPAGPKVNTNLQSFGLTSLKQTPA